MIDWTGRFLPTPGKRRSLCWLDKRQQMLKICEIGPSLSHTEWQNLAPLTLKRALQPSKSWKQQQPVLLLVALVAVAVPLAAAAAVVSSSALPSRPPRRPY
jgi:hypothetical protein